MQNVCGIRTGETPGFDRSECDNKADQLLERVLEQISNQQPPNPFWLKFKEKAIAMNEGKGPKTDALYLLHSNVYYLRDLLEESNDEVGIELLDELEYYCF